MPLFLHGVDVYTCKQYYYFSFMKPIEIVINSIGFVWKTDECLPPAPSNRPTPLFARGEVLMHQKQAHIVIRHFHMEIVLFAFYFCKSREVSCRACTDELLFHYRKSCSQLKVSSCYCSSIQYYVKLAGPVEGLYFTVTVCSRHYDIKHNS